MTNFKRLAALMGLFFVLSSSAAQAGDSRLSDRALGKADAPITVVEYSSLTCSHCGHFYTDVMPEIEKLYINTGKVRFVYHDFPVDGIALKATALARCMPEKQFFGFIGVLYKNQGSWLRTPKPDATILQYAEMAGLPAAKGQACMDDVKLLDAIVAERTEAMDKLGIQATPTFIINNGEEKILGAQDLSAFTAAFDRILAKKK